MAKRKDTRPDTASQRDRLLTAILLAAIFLTYLPVWFSGFTWDDDSVLTGNPVIVGPLGLVEIWTTRAADICPLVLTTFWAEFALWGYHSLPYHLVNLALHAACAILLWRILLALRVPGAWFGAALWALHPVQVETAAWITEMKNTQSGLFYLLTILAFIRGLDARSAGNQARASWAHAATLLCAAAAMASKSSTIVLPIVLALCAWWIEGRWRWRNLFTLAPLAAMAVLPAALTLWTQKLRMQGPEDLQWARSFPRAARHRGRRDLVLPRQAHLAPSPHLHLPALADRCRLLALVRTAGRRPVHARDPVGISRDLGPAPLFRLCLFPRRVIACPRAGRRLLLALLARGGSFSISRRHGSARPCRGGPGTTWRRHHSR